ncbi:hypothetical protein [Acinetobacter pseudolwoffii]|uniref:hypothetical protein n=1 Tax=Acinetobacter pseudolwoffii TaxID=2053287 RepID=UPI0021E4411E|nr:hypothetical protein [Acinetobacter pseudolwoffii]
MYLYNIKHLIFFFSTFFISIFLIISQIINQSNMLSWVSLAISLCFLVISNFLFKEKVIHLFVLYLYHYMFIFSIFVKPEYLSQNIIVNNYWPFILLPVLCYLIIIPFIFLKRENLDFLIKNKNIDIVIIILFPFIVFSFLYLLPHTFNTFLYGAESIRLGGVSNSDYFTLPPNNLTTLAVGVSLFYPFYLFFLFQQMVSGGKFYLKMILVLGVLTGMVGGLVFAGRDRFIFLLFYLIFFYWYWLPYINENLIKKIKKIIKIFFLICFIIFSWISYDRFSDNFIRSSLFYYGAQPYIFAEIYERNIIHNMSYIYPIIFEGKDNIIRSEAIYWTWGTLYQNLYLSGGVWFCIFFALFNNIAGSIFFNAGHKMKYIYIAFVILYFHVVSTGVFYYHLGFPGGNNYIFSVLFIGMFLFILSKVSFKNV